MSEIAASEVVVEAAVEQNVTMTKTKGKKAGQRGRPSFTTSQKRFGNQLRKEVVFGKNKTEAMKDLEARTLRILRAEPMVEVLLSSGRITIQKAATARRVLHQRLAVINSAKRSINILGKPRGKKDKMVEAAPVMPLEVVASPPVESQPVVNA